MLRLYAHTFVKISHGKLVAFKLHVKFSAVVESHERYWRQLHSLVQHLFCLGGVARIHQRYALADERVDAVRIQFQSLVIVLYCSLGIVRLRYAVVAKLNIFERIFV